MGAPALSRHSRHASWPFATHFATADSPSESAVDMVAPAQRSILTTSPCPASAASASGVQPCLSSASTSAPDWSSSRATSACPRWDALWRAVLPLSASAGVLFAPQFTSIRATSLCPAAAAAISGVAPAKSQLGSACACSSTPTSSRKPPPTASTSALQPLEAMQFGSPDAFRALTTCRTSPRCAPSKTACDAGKRIFSCQYLAALEDERAPALWLGFLVVTVPLAMASDEQRQSA
mmetsp:Transcript_48113/g.137427  ORF Transcript_48113/g.137427 Transcript_48113/m.137427 type:complete len:236 (+) Transcript_48113:181-888(+)